jgi:hypothetical protein
MHLVLLYLSSHLLILGGGIGVVGAGAMLVVGTVVVVDVVVVVVVVDFVVVDDGVVVVVFAVDFVIDDTVVRSMVDVPSSGTDVTDTFDFESAFTDNFEVSVVGKF